jgi:1,4-dihydroxy-2-naphthoyl-CoA hydrolase
MFVYHTTIRLHNTDAAGIMFFAEFFTLAHDAYESFMESIGYPFAPLLKQSEFLLPIVHAEADYKKSLLTGDKVKIQLTTEKIGDSSFILAYTISRNDSDIVGTVKTVHALIDKRDGQKKTLMPELREKLKGISQ